MRYFQSDHFRWVCPPRFGENSLGKSSQRVGVLCVVIVMLSKSVLPTRYSYDRYAMVPGTEHVVLSVSLFPGLDIQRARCNCHACVRRSSLLVLPKREASSHSLRLVVYVVLYSVLVCCLGSNRNGIRHLNEPGTGTVSYATWYERSVIRQYWRYACNSSKVQQTRVFKRQGCA